MPTTSIDNAVITDGIRVCDDLIEELGAEDITGRVQRAQAVRSAYVAACPSCEPEDPPAE